MEPNLTPFDYAAIFVQVTIGVTSLASIITAVITARRSKWDKELQEERLEQEKERLIADLEARNLESTERLRQISRSLVEDINRDLQFQKQKVSELEEIVNNRKEKFRYLQDRIVNSVRIVNSLIKRFNGNIPTDVQEDIIKLDTELDGIQKELNI